MTERQFACGLGYALRISARLFVRDVRWATRGWLAGIRPPVLAGSSVPIVRLFDRPGESSAEESPIHPKWPRSACYHEWIAWIGDRFRIHHAPVRCVEVERGCVFADGTCAVIDDGGELRFVADLCDGIDWPRYPKGPIPTAIPLPKDVRLVPLGGLDAANYYHWLYQCLPRVWRAQSAWPAERLVFGIAQGLPPYVRQSLEAVGLDQASVLEIGDLPVHGRLGAC